VKFLVVTAASALIAWPAAAQASTPDQTQPAPADTVPAVPAGSAKSFTVSGSVAVQTDYRLRGVSQSDRNPAVQGSLTIAHRSGFYVGTFASNLAGWGTFGGSNLELDAIGGFKHSFGTATVDAGLTWYMYPGGANKTEYAELFGKLSGTAHGHLAPSRRLSPTELQQGAGRYRLDRREHDLRVADRGVLTGETTICRI
jgi:uncharacterized protein (TIGR02001 family)